MCLLNRISRVPSLLCGRIVGGEVTISHRVKPLHLGHPCQSGPRYVMNLEHEATVVDLNFFGWGLHLVGLVTVGVDQGCVEVLSVLVLAGAGDV